MILKKLPSSSDVAQLSNLDLHSFTNAFNANAITTSIARVELTNDDATVILGDFAWEIEENDWYEIIVNVTESIKPEPIQSIIDYINEGEPDINVVKSELGEIIERHNGTYHSTES
jgi:hypothetical protein